MKKLLVSALILATVSPVWAEAGPRNPRNSERRANRGPAATAGQARTDAAVLNGAFRDLAKALASTLNDPGSRRLIQQEVGKKFDGDFIVLYRDLANRPVGKGRAFRQALGGSFAKVQGRARTVDSKAVAQRDLDDLTASLPKLQIAVPAGFAEWDPETQAPLVTFVPEGIDDDELVEVEAFDAAGRSFMLDARIEPSFPVVVIGLNERTDENGYLDKSASLKMVEYCVDQPYLTGLEDSSGETVECDSGGGGGGGYYDPYDPEFGDNPYEPIGEPVAPPPPTLGVCDARTHNYGDKEILYQIKINNDHEPWLKGSPEIYAAYSAVNGQGSGQYHMSNVDNEGTWYTINGHLFYWQSHFGNTFAVAIWEKDGTNYGTFSYSYSGFTYTVPIHDGDDQLGSNPVSFFDPVCGYYSTGDAEYKMRYQAP